MLVKCTLVIFLVGCIHSINFYCWGMCIMDIMYTWRREYFKTNFFPCIQSFPPKLYVSDLTIGGKVGQQLPCIPNDEIVQWFWYLCVISRIIPNQTIGVLIQKLLFFDNTLGHIFKIRAIILCEDIMLWFMMIN